MNENWLSTPDPEQLTPFEAPASSGGHSPDRGFTIGHRMESHGGLGRTGVIHTAHGTIATPAFIPVGTKANVKALTPEMVRSLGAQAVLANAYHLYLQPGSDIIDEAGGFGRFMNWSGPTYTDSGGFQVLSLGAGFKKVLSQEFSGQADPTDPKVQMQAIKASNAVVDDDGVIFSSHIDGTKHRFNPEVSMGIQHQLGSDIMFAFDELTSLLHPRSYQEESLERTHAWAARCLAEHKRLTDERSHKPYQQLWGVIQGAQWEDLRRQAARTMADMEVDGQRFDGFGVGGALEKENLGTIVSWVCEELGEDRPRHLLGISEPEDLF
ncbi:MAG: tRNA-guanine transglycosylase, partial [Schaalia sp.]|nr:tRNA-guanine transglycosylase [Schaalia sp.]